MLRRPLYQAILLALLLYPAICYRGHRVMVPDANGAVCLVLLVGALVWLRRPRTAPLVQVALGENDEAAPAPQTPAPGASLSARGWWLLAAAFVVAAICWLERVQPLYFTQDDGFSTLLPTVLWGCRSLWQGVFPDWNPHQYLGGPTVASGIFALTYPATYLSYAVARHLLGNEYLTLEVFCISHLLVGFCVTWWAARSLGLRPMLAALVSVCVVLSGFSLIGGRSWFDFTPLLVWVPALVISVARLERGPVSWPWALATGLAVGLFFHNGHTQIWAYAVGFTLLAFVLAAGRHRIPARRLAWVLPALGIGLAIAAPLALVQAQFMSSLERRGGLGDGISEGILSMLVPCPLVRAEHPNGWGSTDLEYMGQFYYFGTLLAAVTFLSWLAAIAFRLPARSLARNPWLVLAAVAFVFALAKPGVLWVLACNLPLLSKFSHPIRFMPFFILYAALGAGVCLERLLGRALQPRRWETGLALGVGALMALHVSLARPSFYTYGDRPYPPLPPAMERLLGPGQAQQRLLSFSCSRSVRPGYTVGLKHSLPSLFGLMSFDGYDPAVERQPETIKTVERLETAPLAAAQAYGIRWLVVHRSAEDPAANAGHNPGEWFIERYVAHLQQLPALRARARLALRLPEVTVWELPGPAPMAFALRAPGTGLPWRASGRGMEVSLPAGASGGEVVANVLWRPWMRVYADGRPLAAAGDEWGRVRASVPAGARTLLVRCEPPWRPGFMLGLLLALLSIGGGVWLSRPAASRA